MHLLGLPGSYRETFQNDHPGVIVLEGLASGSIDWHIRIHGFSPGVDATLEVFYLFKARTG